MIVPHFGGSINRFYLPAKTVKHYLFLLVCCLFFAAGVFIHYINDAQISINEKNELLALRNINQDLKEADAKKQTQIEEMAKGMAVLQNNMNELHNLDNEIRSLLANRKTTEISLEPSTKRHESLYTSNLGGPKVNATVQDVENLIQYLKVRMNTQNQSLSDLKEAIVTKKAIEIATPSIWPANGEVTSRFGWRNSPWGGGGDWHPGIDIANNTGTPIVATAKGVVIQSSYMSGYGNLVVLDHGNGIETAYGHNSTNLAKVGQTVQKGEVIAYMGNTGYSTGPHVHYEVRVNGTAVNPASFL